MPTRTIPQEGWSSFLDSLSRGHRLQPVTVEVSDPDLGFQIEMTRVPLNGMTVDMRSAGGPRIEVMVGDSEANHTTHSVLWPTAVRVEEDDSGDPQVVEVESKSGGKTLVILRPGEFGEPGTLTERPA